MMVTELAEMRFIHIDFLTISQLEPSVRKGALTKGFHCLSIQKNASRAFEPLSFY